MQNNLLIKIETNFNDFKRELLEINSQEGLSAIKNKYTGKNGIFTLLTEEFKLLSKEEKKLIGSNLVDTKQIINNLIVEKHNDILIKHSGLPLDSTFDPYLQKSTERVHRGILHPYTESLNLIEKVFIGMGFEIIEGAILTDEYQNFTALNIPEDHPAREAHDTFWIEEKKLLLRTHTSNVQVSEARQRKAPFAFLSTGLVYRNEATDMSHDFMFGQIEGVYVGDDASISTLLYTLKTLLNIYFEKENLNIRARPGLFPFVEPGLEIDFECPFCNAGCSVCKQTRWIEIGGAGIIHHSVRKEMNLRPQEIGWAFGMGLTRMVMLKYNISDIRLLHNTIVKI
jgi:phenylalanyl-tRNA synthetase alpha chain